MIPDMHNSSTCNDARIASFLVYSIDSGASAHMTPDRTNFVTYRSIQGGQVSVANDTKCAIVGVGNVRFLIDCY